MAGVILVCFVVFGFGGYFLGKQSLESQNYVNDRQNQVSLPSPSLTSDPTANWKTYTNTKYSFSLKYPQSWEIAPNPNEAPVMVNVLQEDLKFEVIFLDKTIESSCGPYVCYPSVQIMTPLLDNSKIRLSLENWLQKYIVSKNPEMKIDPNVDFKKLTVDTYPAIKFDKLDHSVFISKDNYIYFVSFSVTNMPYGKPDYDKTVFDQILSTFKFTN